MFIRSAGKLRLGEHVEGKRQDQKEAGVPAITEDHLAWLDADEDADEATREFRTDLRRSMKNGIPGEPLPNAAYRFNPPGADRSPFRNLGKPGYEAETRELIRLAQELDDEKDRE